MAHFKSICTRCHQAVSRQYGLSRDSGGENERTAQIDRRLGAVVRTGASDYSDAYLNEVGGNVQWIAMQGDVLRAEFADELVEKAVDAPCLERELIRWSASSTPTRRSGSLRLKRTVSNRTATLDGQFREDDCRLRRGHAPTVMAIPGRAALNMLHTIQRRLETDVSIGLLRDRIGRQPWSLASALP